jgi:LmbE family N-acetylglucosaminyl deacetylase
MAGVDILAIAAHRDDVEQTCGGTLLRAAAQGRRTAILDLTAGEAGTRGSAAERQAEAEAAAALLGVSYREALDLAREQQSPHRPYKIVYASLYADVRPSFVVDITPYIEQRHQALMAYTSQYGNQIAGAGLFVPEEEIRERTFAEARHYGLLGGVRYGEPFVQKEIGLVDDLLQLPVQSI